MFGKKSRYVNLPLVSGKDRAGQDIQAVKLRRLPATGGQDTVVTDYSQLDVIGERRYKDAARFWHVADANSELAANDLVGKTGRVIKVPER